jgi:hypothetical protein
MNRQQIVHLLKDCVRIEREQDQEQENKKDKWKERFMEPLHKADLDLYKVINHYYVRSSDCACPSTEEKERVQKEIQEGQEKEKKMAFEWAQSQHLFQTVPYGCSITNAVVVYNSISIGSYTGNSCNSTSFYHVRVVRLGRPPLIAPLNTVPFLLYITICTSKPYRIKNMDTETDSFNAFPEKHLFQPIKRMCFLGKENEKNTQVGEVSCTVFEYPLILLLLSWLEKSDDDIREFCGNHDCIHYRQAIVEFLWSLDLSVRSHDASFSSRSGKPLEYPSEDLMDSEDIKENVQEWLYKRHIVTQLNVHHDSMSPSVAFMLNVMSICYRNGGMKYLLFEMYPNSTAHPLINVHPSFFPNVEEYNNQLIYSNFVADNEITRAMLKTLSNPSEVAFHPSILQFLNEVTD